MTHHVVWRADMTVVSDRIVLEFEVSTIEDAWPSA
jgi:hypothetical protein